MSMSNWKTPFIIHSFKSIQLELVDGEWKKKPKGMITGWSKLTDSVIKEGDKAFGLLTGKKSNVLVLDFDDITLYNEYIMKYPTITQAPRVATRKGFHVYFKYNDKYSELPSKIGKLDIQGNGKQVFYADTEYTTETGYIFKYKWENNSDPFELPDDLFEELKLYSKKPKSCITSNNNFVVQCNDKLWEDIIENISIKYIDEYTSWFRIVCGLYSLGKENNNLDHYKEVARAVSSKSKKYDKTHKEFERMWESCHKYAFTAGSVRHYSRESNEYKYLEICKKHSGKDKDFYVFDEKLICDYFIESYGDNLVCNFNKIFIFYNNNWIEDNNGIIIQKFLKQTVTSLYKRIIDQLNKELQADGSEHESISKNIKECTKVLTNYGNQKNKNVWGLINSEVKSRNIDKHLFDTQKNIFVFTNKAYNLETCKWYYINKFDYILTTCGNEYKEPNKTQLDKVEQIFDSIFPNENYKKAYISVLKSGLSGTRVEKFILATGGGRNGKGLINDFYQHLLGDYYGILHLSLLTKEFKSGAHTELRNLHKKRFVKATEPDSGSSEKLRMSNIKALTGESSLKARGLYENNFDIQIHATQVLECNKLPFINTDGNEAEKQRMVLIPFEVTFTENQEQINSDPKYNKPLNAELKTNEFYEEHFCALFKYIITSYEGLDVYIPDDCKSLAIKWMLDKDDFVGWFMENYEERPNNLISVKSLYKEFKESSFFSSMSKSQQRQNNEKAFKEMLQCKLKHLFVPVFTYVNKVKVTKDSIKGYVKKDPLDDIE